MLRYIIPYNFTKENKDFPFFYLTVFFLNSILTIIGILFL